MKAIKEIGLKNTAKFIIYTILDCIYGFALIPPIRTIFLTSLGAKVGTDSILMKVKFFNWYHKGPQGLRIGKKCFVGDEVLLDLHDSIIMEDNVTLAARVIVLTHMNIGYNDHPLQKFFPPKSSPVNFKNGSVIGAGAIILPGLTIGTNSFVGAGSVVTKDVPNNCLFAGNPAKFIRKIK